MPAPGDTGPTDPAVTDNTGAARYRIPIAVPPGPGGFAPQLALGYSSRAGDGPFGVGFSIAIPEIRCSGRFGVPDFTDCETYELAGTLLVEDPAIANEFHTFVESFRRIEYLPASDAWTVEQPDGTKLFFGTTAAHRIAQGGGTARWLLERMEDAFENRVFVTWDTASDVGSAYPEAITYGVGAAPGSGPRAVTFVTESRPDPRLVFHEGLRRTIGRRVREIRVFGHGQLARRLVLEYAAPGAYLTDRSRLAKVHEFGSDCSDLGADPLASCTGLPPVVFTYRSAADVSAYWSENEDYRIRFGSYPHLPLSTPAPHYRPQLIGDLDGDGLPDRLEIEQPLNHPHEKADVHVWINTGSGFHGVADTGPWADLANLYTQSFQGLTYSRIRLVYEQIPVPASAPYSWWSEFPETYFTLCSVSGPTLQAGALLADDLRLRGLSAETSPAGDLENAAIGSPVAGFFEPRPSIRLVDLDADGRAELLVSVRLAPIARHFDCNGNPLAQPEVTADASVTVVYRNTGTGWVNDAAAQALAAGLPPLEEAVAKSSYQTTLDHPTTQLNDADDVPTSPCANLGVRGFEQHALYLEGGAFESDRSGLCYTVVDLAPQFHDFDGDGLVDLAVLRRDRADSLWTGYGGYFEEPDNRARTEVWVQTPGGAMRWARAPQYDLPADLWTGIAYDDLVFAHTILYDAPSELWSGLQTCYSWDGTFAWCGPATHRIDAGLRFADLNRDGLTDLAWSGPNGSGVMLNAGAGAAPSSAWCIASTDPAEIALVGSSCPEAAAFVPPRAFSEAYWTPPGDPGAPPSAVGHLADLDGDGWLDFALVNPDPADGQSGGFFRTKTWLFAHDDGTGPEGHWREDSNFRLPVDWGEIVTHVQDPSITCLHGDTCGLVFLTRFLAAFQLFDINGDGTADLVGDIAALVSQLRHGDLVREIDNGRGGVVDLEYDSAILQRDAALETTAEAKAPFVANPDGTAAALWRPLPVVSQVTVSGPDFAPAVRGYRYARPRFCTGLRSDLGFGLVETTGANGSRAEAVHYQDHGRAGRLSSVQTFDASDLVHQYTATWVHAPPGVPGAIGGLFHGRLVSESSWNEYAGQAGATASRALLYDDVHGYDFVSQVVTSRPTGMVYDQRTPDSDLGAYVVGRIARQTLTAESPTGEVLHDTGLFYTDLAGNPTGPKLGSRQDLVGERGGGPASWVDTLKLRYDAYGNVVEEWRPSPTGAGPGASTLHCTDGDVSGWCAGLSPEGQSSHSVRVATMDPLGHVVQRTPDDARGTILAVVSSYADEPATRVALDPFGRVAFEYATPEGGAETLVADRVYSDVPGAPLAVTRRDYSDASQGDWIESAVVQGAFGRTWKTIAETPQGYVGTARFRDAAGRLARTTLPVDCGGDPFCMALTGVAEPAAEEVALDALGRPVRVETPEGFSVLAYAAAAGRGYPAGLGGPGPFDAVLVKNGKGDLLERIVDGDRVVWVDECHAGVAPGLESLAGIGCGAADTTLYRYAASGEIETVWDARAVALGSYADPDRFLRYDLDTLGRPIRIHDPDVEGTGYSETVYNDAGLVASTTNARGQTRSYAYDDLGRLVGITTPSGEDDYTVTYRTGELQREQDFSAAYTRVYAYDPYGRLARTVLTVDEAGWPHTFVKDYAYDLAGRLVETLEPESTRIRREYAGGYLERVCDLGGEADCTGSDVVAYVADAAYDALGRRTTTTSDAGTRTFAYVGATARLATDRFDAAGTGYWFERSYTAYDGLGNVTAIAGADAAGDLDLDEAYAYDARNRLAQWTKEGTVYAYGYDELGNLTLHAGQPQVYDDAGRPHAIQQRPAAGVSYAYDADGNVASATGGGADRYFTFDSANRLICLDDTTPSGCGLAEIHYDVDGAKVLDDTLGTHTSFRAYLDGATRIEAEGFFTTEIEVLAFGERVALKRGTGALRAAGAGGGLVGWPEAPPWLPLGLVLVVASSGVVWAGRRGALVLVVSRPARAGLATGLCVLLVLGPLPLARAGGGGGDVVRWELADRLGTGLVMVDETGARAVARTFMPFGKVYAEAGPESELPVHYGGHLREEHAGLFYMNARWYDPDGGGFLSIDPIVSDAGSPQTHNAYSYAGQNPRSRSDPTGMGQVDCFGACAGYYWGYTAEGNFALGFWSPSFADIPSSDFGSLNITLDFGDFGSVGNPYSQTSSTAGFEDGIFTLTTVAGTGGGLHSSVATSQSGQPVTAAQGSGESGGFWSTVGRVAGHIWNLPNTVLGAAYGLIGIPTEGIGFEHGQLQFKGNLLQRGLGWLLTGGGNGAITLGDAGVYPTGFGPDTPMQVFNGQTITLGLEESFHSAQGRILGPLYLPANIVGGAAGLISNGYWHGPANFMERGPHASPPRVF